MDFLVRSVGKLYTVTHEIVNSINIRCAIISYYSLNALFNNTYEYNNYVIASAKGMFTYSQMQQTTRLALVCPLTSVSSCRYYGCGLVFPEAVENCCVVDLGSGSGRDCYILSRLVGEGGYVTGVDMTKEQVSD